MNFERKSIEHGEHTPEEFNMIDTEYTVLKTETETESRKRRVSKALIGISVGVALMAGSIAPSFGQESEWKPSSAVEEVKKKSKAAFEELERELKKEPARGGDIFEELEREAQKLRERQQPGTEQTPGAKEPTAEKTRIAAQKEIENLDASQKTLLAAALAAIEKRITRLESMDYSKFQNPSLRSSVERNNERLKKQLQEILKNPNTYLKNMNVAEQSVFFSGSFTEESQGTKHTFDHIIKLK